MKPLLVALALLLVTSAPAHAADPPVVGWWYEPQQIPAVVPLDLPAPAYVPAGDLLVEGTSSSPDAVAAVRILLPAGQDAATLTVPVVSTRGNPSIEVCATLSGWAPASAGEWDMRPACGGTAVPMVLSKDGASLSANVRTLAKDGVLDVLLQPGEATAVATSVTLAPPTTAALTTTPSAGTQTPAPESPAPVASEPVATPVGPAVLPPVAGPVLPGVVPPVAGATPSVVPPTPQVASSDAPPTLPRVAALSTTKGRGAALLLLLLTGLSGLLLARRSRAGEGIGGVGRYRTERTGTPAVRL